MLALSTAANETKLFLKLTRAVYGLMRAILGDFNFNLVLHEFEVDCFLDKETENFVRSKKDFKFVSVKSVSCPLSSQPEYKEHDFIHNVYWPRMGPGALIPIISWGD